VTGGAATAGGRPIATRMSWERRLLLIEGKLDDEKKAKVAKDLHDLMIEHDVYDFAIKRDIHAAHALAHGVISREARTAKVSFDIVIKEENVDYRS
jgi:hypothetical protein